MTTLKTLIEIEWRKEWQISEYNTLINAIDLRVFFFDSRQGAKQKTEKNQAVIEPDVDHICLKLESNEKGREWATTRHN